LHGRRGGARSLAFVIVAGAACIVWQYAAAVVVLSGHVALALWPDERGGARARAHALGVAASSALALALTLALALLLMREQVRFRGFGDAVMQSHTYRMDSPQRAAAFVAANVPELLDYFFADLGTAPWAWIGWIPAAALVAGTVGAARAGGRGRA